MVLGCVAGFLPRPERTSARPNGQGRRWNKYRRQPHAPKTRKCPLLFLWFCEDRQLSVAFLGAAAGGWGGWALGSVFFWWCSVASSSSLVAFGGSRSLPASAGGLVASVVGACLRAGCSVSVGCAVGADQLVLSAALAAPGGASRLSVFAVGAASGAGFWSGSALPAVRSAAAAGARVVWLAGGALSLPLRARLALRSRAGLVGASGFVLFLASPSSPGSLSVAVAAVAAGLPVFAFAVGFVGAPLAPRGCPGSWVPSSLAGFACWRWVPVASQPALF